MLDKNTMDNCCSSIEKIQEYLEQKALTHNSYKYYSRIEYIRPIVHDKVLYLNTGERWNDVVDRENFMTQNKEYINFGKCFSFSQDESIAMWMLYGGIYHTGAMIDFTRTGMNNILKCTDITIGILDTQGFRAVKSIKKTEFKIWMTDVVYCNEKTRYLKRSNESCCSVNPDIIRKLGPRKKFYPWNYENECRLIVSIEKENVPKGCNAIKIDLSQISLGKSYERVYLCPDYVGVREKGFQPSKLSGQVEWELRDKKCLNCTK